MWDCAQGGGPTTSTGGRGESCNRGRTLLNTVFYASLIGSVYFLQMKRIENSIIIYLGKLIKILQRIYKDWEGVLAPSSPENCNSVDLFPRQNKSNILTSKILEATIFFTCSASLKRIKFLCQSFFLPFIDRKNSQDASVAYI